MKIVFSAVPVESAEKLASTLVEERLAACVSVHPRVVSVYRWQGRVERAEEALLVVKTSDAALDRVIARLSEIHPYSVPEIVAIDAVRVNAAYLDWVDSETSR